MTPPPGSKKQPSGSKTQASNTSRPPSVDKLARSISHLDLPHPLAVEVARQAISADQIKTIEELGQARQRQMLTPVINATGVLLHTNLGRAPLSAPATGSPSAAHGASNLELSLADGKRGSRQQAVGDLLASATGAEAAMVVNNCAGAVLLVLAALASGRGAAVSRGELVEIGGGFRIPDVMNQSGANLIEVGTTNRTRVSDFEQAVAKSANDVALIMQIHQSNYQIVGFTEAAPLADLCQLGVPVVADIGSGLLDAACPWLDGPPPAWLASEPAAKQALEAGAGLVLFSGDKLFGGPQAGIIAGNADLVAACSKHPLARALRPGSLVLTTLQETTLAYLDRAGEQIPFWQMATHSLDDLTVRARSILADSGTGQRASIIDTEAVPGGGTLPGVSIPSIGIEFNGDHVDALRAQLRPIIARVTSQKTTVLDLRTIDQQDDRYIAESLQRLLATDQPPA